MTETMVERVAKAIAPKAWAALGQTGRDGDSLAQESRRTASLRHARAAIEAMREPTEAMKAVEGVHWDYSCHICGGLTEGWYAMIDEALKPTP